MFVLKNRTFWQLCLLFIAILVLLNVYDVKLSHLLKKKNKRQKYKKHVQFKCSQAGTQHDSFIPGIKFVLYILSHDELSFNVAVAWSKCKPWTKVIKLTSTVYFESYAYKEVYPQLISEWESMDFVGIVTYRSLKFIPLEKLKAYLELANTKPYDVVPLYGTGEYLMDQAIHGHTKMFQSVWDNLLLALNYDLSDIRKQDETEVFLRNSFIIRPKWLSELMIFMNYAINTVDTNSTLGDILATNAHYQESVLRKSVAQRIFHTDYYQWHPFIFERLPPFFLSHRNASVYTSLYQTSWFDFENSEDIFIGL